MYAVVYQNRVIVGPMDWNRGIFQGSLARQGVNVLLPRAAPAELPLSVSNDAKIMSVLENKPSYNPMVEYLYGPLWEITDTHAVANYQVVDSPIDAARTNFRAQAADERYKKETAGVTVQIQGIAVTADTSRDGRSIFVQALGVMQDGQTLNWKFPEGWLVLTKSDLATVVSAGASHIQSCFDWEKQINDQIDAATTKQQLLDIQIIVTSNP